MLTIIQILHLKFTVSPHVVWDRTLVRAKALLQLVEDRRQKWEAWQCITKKRPNNHVLLIGWIHTDVAHQWCCLWQHNLPLNKARRMQKLILLMHWCVQQKQNTSMHEMCDEQHRRRLSRLPYNCITATSGLVPVQKYYRTIYLCKPASSVCTACTMRVLFFFYAKTPLINGPKLVAWQKKC